MDSTSKEKKGFKYEAEMGFKFKSYIASQMEFFFFFLIFESFRVIIYYEMEGIYSDALS